MGSVSSVEYVFDYVRVVDGHTIEIGSADGTPLDVDCQVLRKALRDAVNLASSNLDPEADSVHSPEDVPDEYGFYYDDYMESVAPRNVRYSESPDGEEEGAWYDNLLHHKYNIRFTSPVNLEGNGTNLFREVCLMDCCEPGSEKTFHVFNSFSFDESIANVNTENVTCMDYMFGSCDGQIDVSGFDTRNVTSMCSTFANCRDAEHIDISKWDMSQVRSVRNMFRNCSSLDEVDMPRGSLDSLKSMDRMFSYCSSLERVDMSGMDLPKLRSASGLFSSCSNLSEVGLPNVDFGSFERFDRTDMFDFCDKLDTFVNVPFAAKDGSVIGVRLSGDHDDLACFALSDDNGGTLTVFWDNSDTYAGGSVELSMGEAIELRDKALEIQEKVAERQKLSEENELLSAIHLRDEMDFGRTSGMGSEPKKNTGDFGE